ncbi:DegT/DnrJ/EryC1/StrS family aminotransferase [Hymenobacter glaciei]|uniref:DegT/DnrJ/EryC1/StrS family aminotransferase n=1 Tax=Hymenobacter glaciei TaxID=877209 RepID=A0ABP7UGY2_9BACT
MITVTKAVLPPLEEYVSHLAGVWERARLTNDGPLLQELEAGLEDYLGVPHVHFTSNGTIALQLAIRALDLTGEIITTPFSYVATTSAILWERCQPVFVDIENRTFCIDADKIEAAITPRTSAILATHVYGYPCDVVQIEAIAQRHGLKVIYDGAHAFGSLVGGRALLSYGDIATCSFHATKLFHTGEGGAIVVKDDALSKKAGLLKSFGHVGDEHYMLGINGKNSELHAAMGLCLLPRVPAIIEERAALHKQYRQLLAGLPLRFPSQLEDTDYNFAYFPVLFATEAQALKTKALLTEHEVDTRRYFFPSLNRLPYHTGASCPVSEDVSERTLCLPFYPGLSAADVLRITAIVAAALAPRMPASYFCASPVATAVHYSLAPEWPRQHVPTPPQRLEAADRFPRWEAKRHLGTGAMQPGQQSAA